MRSPESDERVHVTLDGVDPKEVLASLRNADVATTLRLPTMSNVGDDDVTLRGRRDELELKHGREMSAPRLPRLERTALDAALEAAARAERLEGLEDLDDDSPTIRGTLPVELEGIPEELPTVPAATMVREALLAATKAALTDGGFGVRRRWATEPSKGELPQCEFEEAEEDRTLRADRRARTLAMQGDRAAPMIACTSATASATNDASSSRPSITSSSSASSSTPSARKPRLIPAPMQPPALPVPLMRRVDAWIDELPEAARRVLLDARDAQPSWPIVERTEGAVLVPKQRIPSLRPRQ